jgi:hypothetical protein
VVWSRTSCTAGMPCRHAKTRRSMLQLSVARSKLVHLAWERCSIPPRGILFLQPQCAHGTELGLTPPTSAPWDWARPSHPCHTCTGTWFTPPTGTAAETAWRPVPLQPHPHRDWDRCFLICTGTRLTPAEFAPGLGLTPPTFAPRLGSPLPPWHWDLGSRLPTSAPGLGSLQPHLRRDWAHPPTSAPGLGSPLPHLHRDWAHPYPHLHRDWAHPCRLCTGTWAHPYPHLHRDWARSSHTCDGTGLTHPHLRRDWVHRCHICTETGLTPTHICTGTRAHPTHICTGTGLNAATPPTRIRLPGLQLQQAGFPLGPHSLPLSK